MTDDRKDLSYLLHLEYRDEAVNSNKYEYFHMLRNMNETVTIKGYDEYPSGSVLEGQTRINFIDSFDQCDEALMLKLWGQIADWSNKYLEPINTFDHLPDEGDGW